MGDTKASYDPKKCEGKAGRKKERIHHRIVEKMEARCTFENFTKNYNEQEKEGDAYHFIPAIGWNNIYGHRFCRHSCQRSKGRV